MSCCGKLGTMDLETLSTWGWVKIEVTRAAFGVGKGVYKVGDGVLPETAIRLLNNRNAIIKEYGVHEINERVEQEPVSVSTEDIEEAPQRPRKSTKTRRKSGNKSKRGKKTGFARDTISEGSEGRGDSDGSSENVGEDSGD